MSNCSLGTYDLWFGSTTIACTDHLLREPELNTHPSPPAKPQQPNPPKNKKKKG